ncbi:thiamine pyrophosphate-binding protein [Pseudonocardia abyssalis]|uniref:Thiamine pyrophosphate-binding protein n=1 Tax=Pseudonocardia abyssalis TaxID=2792008 RepID=A0ABS6UKG6_9PSEU|nr:thiamine pyrophosphate-binding protein [Pseudonocardia abyssalis]MBW0118620.1 thiamine pyrophosphate-binding protein [Pseudonocardia abyssalis]MBW0132677.1 thiamine pyrophosphate-binding protein [Pseudonocardia abyssalis]
MSVARDVEHGGARRSGGAAVAETLDANGVDTVFGTPGHPLVRHLAAAGLSVVTLPDDDVAERAAAAYARVSGRPGVVAAADGPAGTGSQALLFITAHGGGTVRTADAAVETVAGALAAMLRGRPRAVQVDVPRDVLDQEWSGSPRAAALPSPLVPHPDGIRRAADLLEAAERPLVIAGGGAVDASDEITALIQALGAPVATTAGGKGVVDDGHPLSAGASGRLPAVAAAAAESDVVLVVGSGFACPDGVAAIRIDVDVDRMPRNGSGVGLLGDATATVAALRGALPPWRTAIGVVRAAALRAACREQARADGRAFELVNDVLRDALPPHGVLVGGSTPVTRLGSVHFFPIPAPRLFCPGGVPAAIGACVARPARPVAVLLGTGAFAEAAEELAAAVELGLPIPVVVMRDGSGDGPTGGRSPLDVGALEVRANEPDDLVDLVADAFEADRPTVIRLG